jgi:chemotaxis protein CheD
MSYEPGNIDRGNIDRGNIDRGNIDLGNIDLCGPGEHEPNPPESTAYLYPGQLFASAGPEVIMTIVGSCVAVCVWDSVAGAGGLNHYLLPRDAGRSHSALRFGSAAIPELVRRVLDLGGRRKQLLAKIFGGAGMIEGSAGRLSAENVEIARRLLAEAQIPIVAEDVGGRQGRKLICRVRDGSAWVKLA